MMARVNRTTGVFLILGVVVLIISVAGTHFITRDVSPSAAAATEDELLNPVIPDIYGTGKVDLAGGLVMPVPGVPGRVTDIFVKEGEDVVAGQKILKVNDTEARFKIQQAQGQLNQAKSAQEELNIAIAARKAELEDKEKQVEMAKSAWAVAAKIRQQTYDMRRENLVKDLDLTQAQFKEDEAHNTYDRLVKALEAFKRNDPMPAKTLQAERAVKLAEEAWRAAEQFAEEHILHAPKDGAILQLNVKVGEAIGQGSLRPPVLFRPQGELIVRAEIDQNRMDQLKLGLSVTLTNRGDSSSHQWHGTVEKVGDIIGQRKQMAAEPDTFSDAHNCECIIRVDADPKHPLRLGQSMNIRIHPNSK
jgi:multidrug resistance efflux pump